MYTSLYQDDLSLVRRALTRKPDYLTAAHHPNPHPHRRRSSSDKHMMLMQLNSYKPEMHESSHQQLEGGQLLGGGSVRGGGDSDAIGYGNGNGNTATTAAAIAPGSSGNKRRSSNSRVFFAENEMPPQSNEAGDPNSGSSNINHDTFTHNAGSNNAGINNNSSSTAYKTFTSTVNSGSSSGSSINVNGPESQTMGNAGFQYVGSLQQVFHPLSRAETPSPPQPPASFIRSTLSESSGSRSLQSLSSAPHPTPPPLTTAYSPQQASEVEYFFQSPPPPAHTPLRGAPVIKQNTRTLYSTLTGQQRSSGGSVKSKSGGSTLTSSREKDKERNREKDGGTTELRLAGSAVSPEIAKLLKTSRTSSGIPVTSIDLGATASIKRFQNYH